MASSFLRRRWREYENLLSVDLATVHTASVHLTGGQAQFKSSKFLNSVCLDYGSLLSLGADLMVALACFVPSPGLVLESESGERRW